MAFLIIILVCYIVVAIIRKTSIQNEWLPLISGALGLLLSALAFYVLPTIVPSLDFGTTVAYGFFCGLAATGSNQVFKQALQFIERKCGIDIDLLAMDTNNDKGDK